MSHCGCVICPDCGYCDASEPHYAACDNEAGE